MKTRASVLSLASVFVIFSFQTAHAQVVIGPPDPQQVPIMGAPVLLILGGLLAYIAFRFRGAELGRMKMGLLVAGSAALLSVGSGISLIESSEATAGNFVVISSQSDTSYNILQSQLNNFQNNTGITLEVKSLTLPASNCPDNPIPSVGGLQRCSVGISVTHTNSCRIDCTVVP
ncbi:midcut-by-XrtH protein [Pseudoteredinibacter isoporae]|uniref:midcut-by-XrtH protein n=1 Tax=Pseudoteredinibacter isoporae TaxID=570281 RepID=UPI00333E1A95